MLVHGAAAEWSEHKRRGGEASAGTVRVLDVAYERSTPPLTFDRAPAAAGAADYAADEGERLFYAGDFTSRRAPGFEAAALSGLDAASALKRVLGV